MRIFIGKAVSNKQTKTVIVEVERFFRHPLYERRMRRTKRYQVHTEVVIPLGGVVRFIETKPISKNKRWKVAGETTVYGLQSTAKKVAEEKSATKKAVVSRRKSVVKK